MLIVCAGRSRSGSTLMYNLVRLTLIEFFGKNNARGVKFYKKKHECKYNIIKLHDSNDKYFEKNADYIFSTHRDESNQRKSIIRFRRIIKNYVVCNEDLNEFIKYDYSRYKKWSSHKNFVKTFEYNLLVNSKEEVIKEISNVFNLNITSKIVDIIIKKINNLEMPSRKIGANPETCLTWHHKTGGIK